ncbi:MAG: hypothetical protein NDF54_00975 [archaeon GB-1867-035]|nr:hypothetical protein [Candidatus Culexmicrobium profundum]
MSERFYVKYSVIIKRLISGVFSGVFNYILYFIIPSYIYLLLTKVLPMVHPELSEPLPYIPSPTIEIMPLVTFIILCCISSLLADSWLGFIVGRGVSSYFMAYALILLNFGRISAQYQGISISLDFSILVAIWFCAFILDSVARAFDLIEREVGFLPTF